MILKESTKLMRIKELLLTTCVDWIPTIALGVFIRNIAYRFLFKKQEGAVYIQDGAEFIGTHNIEIGAGTSVSRGVRIALRCAKNRMQLGSSVTLEHGADIRAAGDDCSIEIGDRTFIGPYVCIAGPGNIKIGRDCLIAAHTAIAANSHNFADFTEKIHKQGITRKGIAIGDDCWLGFGVKVLDGVTIGQGSVIGAGSVVTKSIPPYSVAVGVPARVIRNRQPLENEFTRLRAS